MKNSRKTAGVAAAAALAAGLVLTGAGTATAAEQQSSERITTQAQLQESLLKAVALERESGPDRLSPQANGRATATALPC